MEPGPSRRRRSGRHPGAVRVRVALLLAVLLAVPGAAVAQTPLAAPGQPGWAPAGNSCFVWNRAPTIGEAATWAGPCANQRAEGKGVLTWRTGLQEQRYEGELRDGHLNGQGVYHFTLTSRYEGGFKDDDFEGRGTLIEPGVRYEGLWKAGKKNGKGVLTTLNGDRYEGEFKDDALTGRGVLVLSDKRKYDGLLLNGKPHGQGTLVDPTGTYTGVWSEGCLVQNGQRASFATDLTKCPGK